MLSDLAHELRTPIATLSAYHEGLHDGIASLGPDSRAALTEQTERLTRLADDIDEVSTAEEGRLDLDLHDHAVADLLWAAHEGMRERYAAQGVSLVIDPTAAAGLAVKVDRHRIGQVLTNLLTNAPLRHTLPWATVTVAAQRDEAEVGINVTDNGEGMTPEQRARLRTVLPRGLGTHSRPHRLRHRPHHQQSHRRRPRRQHHRRKRRFQPRDHLHSQPAHDAQ